MRGLLLRKCYDARRRMPNADSGMIFGAPEWVLFPETVVQVDPPMSPWNQSLPKWVARETSTLPLWLTYAGRISMSQRCRSATSRGLALTPRAG